MNFKTPNESQVQFCRREDHYGPLFREFVALRNDESLIVDPEPDVRIQVTAQRIRNALNQRAMVAGLPYTTSVKERIQDRKLIVKKWFGKKEDCE
jgi:hypothetical protein